MGLAWESIYYIHTYAYVYHIYIHIYICRDMYLYLYPYRRQTKSSIFMRYCGVVRCGAWREDVDKNKMDNHLPYKLELENMPAIKEGKIKTAFTKGGREWERGRMRVCVCVRARGSVLYPIGAVSRLPAFLPACLTYLVRELASLILLEQQPHPPRSTRTPQSHDTHCSLCHIYIYVFMWFPS